MVIAVTADISDRALLALQTPSDSVLMLFPDQVTALRTIGMAGAGALATPPRAIPRRRDLAGLRVDQLRGQVTWDGKPLPLTRLELGVLGCLATGPARVWPYGRLYRAVWGMEWLGDSSTLHAVVKRLRRKLRDAGVTVTVEAVRGVGFRLAVDVL